MGCRMVEQGLEVGVAEDSMYSATRRVDVRILTSELEACDAKICSFLLRSVSICKVKSYDPLPS